MGGLGPRLGGESDPPSTPSAGKRARLPGRRWPISLDLAGGSSGRGPRIEAGSRTRDNSSRPSTAIHSSTHPSIPSHPIFRSAAAAAVAAAANFGWSFDTWS
ncbi:uncharacterized protein AtWU_09784 [Aspergillus tubingensis]|uniref:uncharacterized protein n=1 Tax=Aspergillus tubingensis TaxID=5068 RepID=UPI0015793B65|nr:uncharacterized protein AtWU_09784 [Aspergillus tubingensis]GFN19979.1 hypothetical protein AtWU_09784 [Aspergillus tubingensis]